MSAFMQRCEDEDEADRLLALEAMRRAEEAWREQAQQLSLDVFVDIGTCQSCGRYLDRSHYERCPSPCDGYIG